MNVMTDPDALIDQPGRVQVIRRAVETAVDGIDPLIGMYQPYVDGLSELPRDGRFLLVGNHSRLGIEGVLIPYIVRKEIGIRVRPLTDRAFAMMPWPLPDLLAACGATVGAAENVRKLAQEGQPIAVFPGGRREITKFDGEEYTLNWADRAGFARLAVEHRYPIVPVAAVGGDDVYRSFTSRDGWWGRLTQGATQMVAGKADMGLPLVHGVGVTMIPRPQRMYLKFGTPIVTDPPTDVAEPRWVGDVRDRVKGAIEADLAELLHLRDNDPFSGLNPLQHCNAVQPR